ncbi:MAG: thiol oxidoreductase [Flavobacteriaceae bacterium]|nr:thiol oxidoreductase [Flavobacteriaceae bacterium]
MFKKILLIVLTILITSCELTSPLGPEEFEVLDGLVQGLTTQQEIQFLKGDEAFNEVFDSSKGLGPLFVANQCSTCHPGDGRGTPFVTFTRFGQDGPGENLFLNKGGPQLQHKALPGYSPEALPENATFSDFIAPPVTGLGFLDAVSDQSLIDLSDPNDDDNDGISGQVHWNNIPDYVKLRPNTISVNGKYITRFGKKANAYDLLHQTAGAYNQDMGITSLFEPIDVYTNLEIDPEVTTETVNSIVFYLKTLKAPIQRNTDDLSVIEGREIFDEINCSSCHSPTLKTGYSDISSLSQKEFYPYTDMLLHDMGEELNDNYTEGFADNSEWRTPPLWGLGLSKDAQGGRYFLLHDGRATSIEEAIILHSGEAENSKNDFLSLSKEDKGKLIMFLESL